ncbi:MAG: sugar kinase [Bacteroidetes bacterium]|nr:MAG: sugar kinase [Bacteroidota bacterium]
MRHPLWGIDLGGTKIEGVILPSISNPKPLLRTRIDTEASQGYHHIVNQIVKLVDQMKHESGLSPDRIGFGTPGVLDPVLQTMKNCNSTALNGMPLKANLEEKLKIPVVLANDANCFALAETHWGAVKEKTPNAIMVFGIIMGTGVGGGIVANGKIWEGCHGIAGEWGHNFLDESGGPCYCGKSGCVETIISGPALERFYERISGKKIRLKEIVSRHHQGTDELATRTIDRLCHFFGKAVSVVTNLLDPDVFVIGGGVGNIDALYSEGLLSLKQFIFNNRVDVPIIKPNLGDSAGVFGAAALVD